MIRHVLWLMLLFPLSAAAQTELPKIVEPKQPAPIRESPPTGGLFGGFPGEQLGETEMNRRYSIVGKQQTPYGFSKQTWVEIAPLDAEGNILESSRGWSYWGANLTDDSPNFENK